MGGRSKSHAKYACKYHLIWCPKRRRVLAEECGVGIEEVAVDEDHVHGVLVHRSTPSRGSWAA